MPRDCQPRPRVQFTLARLLLGVTAVSGVLMLLRLPSPANLLAMMLVRLAEAIGRLAGPGAMKGESPVPRLQQAEVEIESWLRSHVTDAAGAFVGVLHRYAKESDLLLANSDQPLVVLAGYCQRILDSDYVLKELVRESDAERGRVMGKRPFFEKVGSPHHPDDPYTVESIRKVLTEVLQQLTVDTPRA